ncbi:hypothetical protein [Pseudoduganella chitinolytica]|uniref:Uncharacterized protein n=1 Tax=Pseudoduganella chitinolytica TaxID=34070 RepID=A0ABY8B9Q4_9BURK|nr:hypothetical protein [Pseudoduganella chitinolytica]WEF32652.1 hypothetical protein PX653_25115 [Pseudoduganella chitinolytica]
MMSLLPHEPRIVDAARQQVLTERCLLPELPALRALFLHLRASADATLAQRQPAKLGKPYPLGCCAEISLALQEALRDLDPGRLPPGAVAGHAALARFQAAGGTSRRVWGYQRGRGMRHALLAGTLLIDAAQDTTDATLPPVALTPFAQAGLAPVRDHRHFALLAATQWSAHVFPNHVLPELAPYAPLLMLVPGGSVRLEADAPYMLALARRSDFSSSAAVLAAPPMTTALFGAVGNVLAQAGFDVAADAAQGKAAALDLCRQYRDAGTRAADARHEATLTALARANHALQVLQVAARPAG